ncbi:SDR family oxidoreductase [Bacillus halotolerans]|uniref:SDR family oxidoreductase n=1 Tax=Bacillus halotolerans TaxID=260554 RepID=UPI0037F9F032
MCSSLFFVNVKGTFFTCQQAMEEQGRIINFPYICCRSNVSDIQHMREQKALGQFTRQLAKELAVKQIIINAVPEDIANVIEFLMSEQSQWITGQTIRVNGGFI